MTTHDTCENCGHTQCTPAVCDHCEAVYPIDAELDDFAFLGLPCAFNLDLEALEARQFTLSRALHPDYSGGRTPLERELSTRYQARINRAVHRLTDPYRRAEYLLTLEGGAEMTEDRATPPGFLEDMLALREAFEERPARPEVPASGEFDDLEHRLNGALDATRALLAEGFARLNACADDERHHLLRDLKHALNAVKYRQNLLAEIRVRRHPGPGRS